MGTLCNLNLVIFKCFYYQSEKIVAGDINSLNLLVFVLFYNLEQTMVKSDNVVPCKYVSASPLAQNFV